MMTVTLAHVGSVKNGRLASCAISPRFLRRTFTAPSGWSMVLMISRETNIGTAQESTKQNLQNPFALVPFRLIIREMIIPKM